MDQNGDQSNSSDTFITNQTDPIQQSWQQLTQQYVIGQTDTVEQYHNNVPFYPVQLPQQAQMTPFPYMQLSYPQQVYNFPFGGNNMIRTSTITSSHSLQSSPVVRMTPSVTVTVTSSFSTLHTSQSRAVDTPITTLHDQYGSSSQQRPLYGMCGYPTGVLPSVPLPPPQDPIQHSQQQLTQHVIGQTDTVEQHHNNVPFYPPQQAQMTPFPYRQLPYSQQVYNSPFGGSDMTWTSSVTASHSLQSSPVVRMTPSVTSTVTSSFSTLHTSQSRAVDTPITTLHDQYGSSSQQRPLYDMYGYPTSVLPPLPLPKVESYLQPQQQPHFAQYAHPHLPYHMMYQPPQQAHMRPQFLPQYQLQQPQQIFGANISGNNMTSSSTGILQASAPQHLTVDTSESVMRYDFYSQQRPQIQNPQWNHSLLQQQAHHAYQQQMNAPHYSMILQQTQQQMRALQSQFQLLQQISFTPTSAGPVFLSRSCTPSTSQTTYSVAPQPTTVHTPVTTAQSYSEQHNSPSLSSSQNISIITTATNTTNCSTSVDGDNSTTTTASTMITTDVITMKAYENYIHNLVKYLPMNDVLFIVSLSEHQLLPGNTRDKIESLPTQADKALYFLDHVIKPALDIEDTSSFDKLLSIMEQCGYAHVKTLACKIKSNIDKGRNINTGVKDASLMEISSSQSDNIICSVEASIVDIISNHSRSVYKKTRFNPSGTEWPPNQPKLVVSVALIHYKGSRTQQELFEIVTMHKEGAPAIDKFTSSANQEPSAKKPRLDYSRVTKNITDIFAADPTDPTETGTSSTESPKRILIEGAPGIGKTVLAKEIAYQWATNEILTEIKILFLIYLRDPQLQSITTTKQLIEYMSMGCLDDEQIAAFNKYLVNSKGQQLCIVVDGFDEYPTSLQKSSFIVNIIKGVVLPEAIVVITSRPTTTVSLHDRVDRRIDILGLPKEERDKYIALTFENSPEKKAELEKYLKQQPVINGLCFVPLHLAILLYLFQQDNLPETLTEMNESFILHTIYRHLERYELTLSDTVDKLKNVPKPILNIVYNLSELAFQGLQQNKLVFTFDEIKQKYPSINEMVGAINGFGLLQAVKHYSFKGAGTTTSFNFLHYTMQEYLAALHVSNLPSEQQSSLMEETFWDGHYNFMWMMFVGIVGINSDIFVNFVSNKRRGYVRKSGIRMADDILNDKRKRLHVFQCYMEAKSSTEAPDVISDMFKDGKVIIVKEKLLPHHISSLMTFMSKSSIQWKTLEFKHCKITDVGMNVLEQFIVEKVSTLECIDLSHNESSPWGLYCAYIRQCSRNSLTLGGDYGMKEYINEINVSLQNNTKLQSLKLKNMTTEGGKLISEIVRTNKTLQRLDLSNNTLFDDGAVTINISDGLKNNNTLLEINISHNNITNKGTKNITEAIQVNKILKKLNLSHNILSDDGATLISSCLKCNISLLELNISHNGITDKGTKEVAEAIEINSTLQNIDISRNHISVEGLVYFMKAVKNNCTLQVVNTTHNNVTRSGFRSIKRCIENLHQIKFYASWNEISWSKKIKEPVLMSRISSSCAPDNIEDDVWSFKGRDYSLYFMFFSECLKEDDTLQELDLSRYYYTYYKITSEEVTMIGKAIKVNKTLQKLDISISDDGAAAFSDGLKYNISLQELNILWNMITSEGVKLTAEAIKVNTTLHTLKLMCYGTNDALSFSMTVLTAVYHNNTLMTLTLPYVYYDDDKRLVSSEVEKINKERTRQGISTLTCHYTSINYNISS